MAPKITVDEILETLDPAVQAEARKPTFMEPLKLLLEGLNNMDVTEEGRKMIVEMIRMRAVQRQEVEEAVVKNPDILNTEISPVVIIGRARTGTTVLQRLLASAPNFVSPMTWEVMNPCPPGRPKEWKGCDRYQKAKAAIESLVPGLEDNKEFQHRHEFNLEKPEECMVILQAYFYDLGLPMYPSLEKLKKFTFNPPEEHLRKAYEFYKKTLQCIFYKGLSEGKILLLKAPVHTLYLDMYRKIFPTARFIFPYRNVYEMIGSGCSIFGLTQTMMKVECPNEALKNYTLEYYKLGTSRVVQTLKSMPKESYCTLSYADMVKDPMAAMKDIYSHFGWDMTPEVQQSMQSHMEENRQHKHGKNKYSLEQYGVSEQEVKDNLTDFLEYFGEENLL